MLIKIYQIKNKNNLYMFMPYDYALENGFNLDDYECVYEYIYIYNPTKVLINKSEIMAVLDSIYEKFNINRPEDFKGHSLSVSDIVEIDGDKYYCNSYGWVKIK